MTPAVAVENRKIAVMRVVKAAIAVRQSDMSKCTGASSKALTDLYQAVDALAIVGVEALIEEL
jgi:hypothetical protein